MAFIDSGNTDINQIGPGVGASGGPLNILSNPNNTTGGISSFLSNNSALTTALGGAAGAGLGLLLGKGSESVPYAGNLQQAAANAGGVAATAGTDSSTLFTTGTSLLNPIQTGTLPTGAQAEVKSYLDKINADTKARYASIGQTGSTMESDALNTNQTNAQALTFQIAQQMAQLGNQTISESLQSLNIAGQADSTEAGIYENLMKAQMTQDASTQSTIGKFASAIGNIAGAAMKAA